MISKYDVGDTVLLPGTITGIEQRPTGEIVYKLREYEVPIKETTIVAKIEEPWRLLKDPNR